MPINPPQNLSWFIDVTGVQRNRLFETETLPMIRRQILPVIAIVLLLVLRAAAAPPTIETQQSRSAHIQFFYGDGCVQNSVDLVASIIVTESKGSKTTNIVADLISWRTDRCRDGFQLGYYGQSATMDFTDDLETATLTGAMDAFVPDPFNPFANHFTIPVSLTWRAAGHISTDHTVRPHKIIGGLMIVDTTQTSRPATVSGTFGTTSVTSNSVTAASLGEGIVKTRTITH